jgi:hypothetical protein
MSISISKYPTILINGHQSKWFPAHQPITFEVKRQDTTVLQRFVQNGLINYRCSFVPNTVYAGQKIQYVISDTVTYTLTVHSVSGNIIRVVYIPGPVSGALGFINFIDTYKGYFIETQVSYIDTTNNYQIIGSVKNKPSTNGIAKVSVQELLATKCINQNDFLYNKINARQFGEGSKFNIQIRENYNGISGKYSSLSTNSALFYSNSAKQIQEQYGYNMAEYVPTYDSTRTVKAKFQSVFKRPTYFIGYPFSLNFLYSDNLLNYQLVRKERTKDINGNTIATTTDNLFAPEREFSNRLMLKQGYTSNVKTIDIWLETNGNTGQNPVNPWNNYGPNIFRPLQIRGLYNANPTFYSKNLYE